MTKNNRRRWILGLLTGIAAVVVVLRRRLQPIESKPLLPHTPPPPSEPPRIVLPTEILNNADSVPESEQAQAPAPTLPSEAERAAADEAPELETEAPLLERAVGGSPAASPNSKELPATASEAASQGDAQEEPEASADLSDDEEHVAYCMSCREKRPMENAHEETTENGRRALRGTCPVCGSKMFRFLPNEDK